MKKADLEAATKQYFKNWETGERDEMEARLGNGFTFTSPRDDHLDGAAFFEQRWPEAGKVTFALQRVHAVGPKDCIVLYEAKNGGTVSRNVELLRFDGDRLLSVEVFRGRPPGEAPPAAADSVRALLEAQCAAIRAKDLDAATAPYAEEAAVFDVVQALRSLGKAAVRDRAQRWFESFEGAIETELKELRVEGEGGVAFAHALQRFAGTGVEGRAIDMWVRVTWGLRKVEGQWLICHQHASVPFEPESGKARLDLTP